MESTTNTEVPTMHSSRVSSIIHVKGGARKQTCMESSHKLVFSHVLFLASINSYILVVSPCRSEAERVPILVHVRFCAVDTESTVHIVRCSRRPTGGSLGISKVEQLRAVTDVQKSLVDHGLRRDNRRTTSSVPPIQNVGTDSVPFSSEPAGTLSSYIIPGPSRVVPDLCAQLLACATWSSAVGSILICREPAHSLPLSHPGSDTHHKSTRDPW